MATLDSINAKIAQLRAQAESLVVKKSTAVLDKIRGLMEQHGIGVSDIEAHVGKRRGRKPGAAAKQSASVAKYADPKTGATWTGHGRAPAWIANAKDRTKFLVAGASLNVTAPAKVAKTGNYARGPQPALYADPKTGSTWSGRGRAPAWIANAKDRTKFLIAGADNAADAPKGKPAKKAVTETEVASAKKATTVKKNVAAPKKTVVSEKPAGSTKVPAKKTARKSAAVPAKKVTVKKSAPKRPASKRAGVNDAASPAIEAVAVNEAEAPSTSTIA